MVNYSFLSYDIHEVIIIRRNNFSIVSHETLSIKDNTEKAWSWDIYIALSKGKQVKAKAISKIERRVIPWFEITDIDAIDEIIEKCKIEMS